jgi:hypothetical protein
MFRAMSSKISFGDFSELRSLKIKFVITGLVSNWLNQTFGSNLAYGP